MPFLRQFATWLDVVAYMRVGSLREAEKDEVLRPIFAAHNADRDARWRTILLVIFWPALVALHRQKRRWDPDPEELWQILTWVFHEVLCRIDPTRRPDRLTQKVVNDTAHHLHDEYKRRWERGRHEAAQDCADLEALAGGADGFDLEAFAHREASEAAIRLLKRSVVDRSLSRADFFLIVGTRLYEWSLEDCAAVMGLDYEAAKKRRQRAEAALRKKFSGSCPLASAPGAFLRQGRRRAPGRSEP